MSRTASGPISPHAIVLMVNDARSIMLVPFRTAADFAGLLGSDAERDAAMAGLSAVGLERQMAVLLYNDDAACQGEPINDMAMEMLPESFISPGGRTAVHGKAVLVGFRDNAGQWTTVPRELVTELVWPNRFWVQVRPSPQGPYEQVGPVYGDRGAVLQARNRWRNAILDRGIDGADISIRSEFGQWPPPKLDVSLDDVRRTIDGWQESRRTWTQERTPTSASARQRPRLAPRWRHPLKKLLERVTRR